MPWLTWRPQTSIQVPVIFQVIRPRDDRASSIAVAFNPTQDRETAPPQCMAPVPVSTSGPMAEFVMQRCEKDVTWGSQVMISPLADPSSELTAWDKPKPQDAGSTMTAEACDETWQSCKWRWRATGPMIVTARFDKLPELQVSLRDGSMGDVRVSTTFEKPHRNDPRFYAPPCTLRLELQTCNISAAADVELDWDPHLALTDGPTECRIAAEVNRCTFKMGPHSRAISFSARR